MIAWLENLFLGAMALAIAVGAILGVTMLCLYVLEFVLRYLFDDDVFGG